MSVPGPESISALTIPGLLKPYQYQPLSTPDSIRVLCLEPAKKKDTPLRGYIIQYDRFAELAKVHSRRKYCAVSYAWGTPEFTEHLEITDPNQNAGSTTLLITLGVKTMLQHFRKPDKKQYLWIDAICLNQNDQAEKTNQIPLMGEIYAQAYKSKFWLGVDDGLKAAKVFAYFRCSASMPTLAVLEQNLPFPNHEEFASQVKRLLKRTWFTRRWILQEARLSQNATMWCGDHSIPYHVFVTACNNIANGRYELENRLNDEYAVQSTHQINSLVRRNNGTEDMSTLLWNFHESACSEERDRFGALYGLIPRHLQPELDLTAPYPRLFQQFAVHEVNRSSASAHRLIIHLGFFGSLNQSKQLGTSSWTPDWSQKRCKLLKNFCNHTDLCVSFPPAWAFEGYPTKVRTIADPHNLDPGEWMTFIEDRIRKSHGDMSCTHLSAYYDTDSDDCSTGDQDQNTMAVLRVRWFHPYGGTYGMIIVSVMTVSDLLPEDTIPVTFLQKVQSFTDEPHKLLSFSLFIRQTLFSDASEDHSVIDVCLISCFAALSGRKWSETSNTGQCNVSDLVQGMLIYRIAQSLGSHSLAILEWKIRDNLDDVMYALGPADVKQDDCMIPLACREREQNQNVDTSWVRYGQHYRLENMMAVRFCDPPEELQITCQDPIVRTDMPLRVRRATFVGVCLAQFPISQQSSKEDRRSRYRAEEVVRQVKIAERGCKLPPYVLDII